MQKPSSTIFLYLTAILFFATTPVFCDDVHDLLPKYGFPRGLLPNNTKKPYYLSPTGDFIVQLSSPCYVLFDRLVYYEKQIEGKLTYGSLKDISGILEKKLNLWVSVTEIEVSEDGKTMELFVGPLSDKVPTGMFEEVPSCRSKVSGLTNSVHSI